MWNCCTVLWMPRSIKILRQGSFRTWCTKGWHLIGSTWDTWPNSEVSRCYSKTMQDLFVITLVPCSASSAGSGKLDAFLLNLDISWYISGYIWIILNHHYRHFSEVCQYKLTCFQYDPTISHDARPPRRMAELRAAAERRLRPGRTGQQNMCRYSAWDSPLGRHTMTCPWETDTYLIRDDTLYVQDLVQLWMSVLAVEYPLFVQPGMINRLLFVSFHLPNDGAHFLWCQVSEVWSDFVTSLIRRSNKEPVQELVKSLLQCCSDRELIWVNYNDLAATSLESWLIREIIPKWP